MSMIAIRAHYDGKVFIPDQTVDLPPGQPLLLQISIEGMVEHPESALEWLATQSIDDPSLPSDLSLNHDHYLYEKPRESS